MERNANKSSHEITETPRSFYHSAHYRAGDATTVVSYQRHTDRKTDGPAQARPVLVESAAFAKRSAHGASEHSTADHARLSQRYPHRSLNREHGLERPRYTGRCLYHSREKADAL